MTALLSMTGGELLRALVEKIISFDFEVLKDTFHVEAQFDILAKSLLSAAVVILGSFPIAVRQVSSAKSRQSHSRSFKMSFM